MLGNRLVGENLNPYLTATLGITGHSDTGCLDLIRGDPARLGSLNTELTVRYEVTAGSLAGHTAAMNATILNSLREQH